MKTDRRNFLKHITTGAALSPLMMMSEWAKIMEPELSRISKNGLPDRSDYSLADDVIYLNHGSIGTMPHVVQEARKDYLKACETNPWLYMWGDAWNEAYENCRIKAADYINADPDEISFAHNTTEIFNLLALGLPLGPGDEVLFCNLNHAGASIPFSFHAEKRGFSVVTFDLPLDDLTIMSKEDMVRMYEEHITGNTKVIALPHIDNTVGIRQPVKEITAMARAKGVKYIALDTAQSMGMIPLDVQDLDIDVIGTSAHKWIQSPKGTSLAYFSRRIWDDIHPMWVTWGQQRWDRSARHFEDYGTRNRPEVLTQGHSIDFQAAIDTDAQQEKLKSLWSAALNMADEHPNTRWRSPRDWELGGSLYAVEIKGEKASDFASRVYNEHGIVLRPFDNLNTIRISPNVFNTNRELEKVFEQIA